MKPAITAVNAIFTAEDSCSYRERTSRKVDKCSRTSSVVRGTDAAGTRRGLGADLYVRNRPDRGGPATSLGKAGGQVYDVGGGGPGY